MHGNEKKLLIAAIETYANYPQNSSVEFLRDFFA